MIKGGRSYRGFLLLALIVIGNSCSVEKNTNLSRFYHNLTSHYNIYFNGKESFDRGIEKIISSNQDNYTTIMSLFEYSNADAIRSASADMDRAIQKASKVISLHSMTAKPENKSNKPLTEKEQRQFEKNDYNRWVDDSYLLLGKAQLMKHDFENARITFLHNIRESDDAIMRVESQIWLARTYAEMNNFAESRRLIAELDTDGLPDQLSAELLLTEADVFIKQSRYQESIDPLAASLELLSGNSPKNRYTYILARIHEEVGNANEAGKTYMKVLKLSPPYELEFNARINQAGVFDVENGNIDDIKRELNKLLRDGKNREYMDQIYYALGNLSMREGKIDDAINYIRKSASVSTVNTNQKGRSYLMLAEYYFHENDYFLSQVYYDSSVTFLDNDYPGFNQFYERSINLNELVGYINTTKHQDSLQYVASLPEAQQQSLINGIIRKIENDERLSEAQTDDRYNMGQFYENQRRFRDNIDVSGKWYFYNQAALTFGRTEFRNRWGQRKLEDNWRRNNKATINPMDMSDLSEDNADLADVEQIADNKSPEFYLKDLPTTDSLLSISDDKIALSLFNTGKILSERFSDIIKANEAYTELIRRYPDSPLIPQTLFNLYNLYKDTNSAYAESNRDLLLSRFPNSEFAKIVSDPDYYESLKSLLEREENLYHQAYTAWERDDLTRAISICEQGVKEFPDGDLTAKFMLLKAFSMAQSVDERTLKEELQKIQSRYPETDEGKRAAEIVAQINEEVPELKIEEEKQIAAEIYNSDVTGPHHFVVVIKSSSLDINRLTFDVINFNIDNYTNENYSTRGELVDDSYIMIIVSTLSDEFVAADYYNQFDITKILKNTGNTEVIAFTVTDANLATLIKDKDPDRYYLFFNENYLNPEK